MDVGALPPTHPLVERLRAFSGPRVTLEHDGVAVEALEGEPVAMALAAAGRVTLSRSPKYHRPHGPACMRGACDGCLVRINDTPGVMACQTAAKPGMKVTSQNAFPTAGLDVFAVTDWFFPKHMDHHRFMVGFGETINRTMQAVARRMAGSGTLPEEPGAMVAHQTREVDVLVVGAGSAGCAAARALAAKGFKVLVAEETSVAGGWIHDDPERSPTDEILHGVDVLLRAPAVATFDNGTLLSTNDSVTLVHARARIFANGCHDLMGTFARNDLPGVYTARGFARALCHGVVLGERVLIVGANAWGERVANVLKTIGDTAEVISDGTLIEARGTSVVNGALVKKNGHEQSVVCDAIVVAEDPVASYELAAQAGAKTVWETTRRAFVPAADSDGTAAVGVFVAGTLRHPWATREESSSDGTRVGQHVAAWLASTSH
jgi:sarcosine oxidase, subunit alpha